MSRFVAEALFIGAKEGVKLSLCVVPLLWLFRREGRAFLAGPLFAGMAVVFAASFAVMNAEATVALREIIVRAAGYSFGIFYLGSLGALFHATGTDLLGPARPLIEQRSVLMPLTGLLAVLYFVPDMAGSSLYVADLAAMAGGAPMVFAAAGAGFGASLGLAFLGFRRAAVDLSRFFDFPQILLSLALVKLLAGGVRGFAELSLIPAVQAGLMKLVHDMVHQVLVMLMVPDHLVLSTTAWNFIGILFGDAAGLWLSLVILALPLAVFLRKRFSEAVPLPAGLGPGAARRKFTKAFRDDRALKSLPVVIFLLFIVSAWFARTGESAAKLYVPAPQPVAADAGAVRIPLRAPAADLRDGAIHTFSLSLEGETVRLLIMKKPDGTMAVCLDACEICPPDGYGQGREHVVCLYCNTPIPFDTVGKPGGCNPVPLPAFVSDTEVKTALKDIAEQWGKVKTGRTGGGGK